MFNKENLNVKQFRGQGFMTVAKFNSNGELLFIADKDSKYITQISTTNNEIIGTYNGHNGVVWNLDITEDSQFMISCSGDMSCILWNVINGEILNRINQNGIPKYVSINKGDKFKEENELKDNFELVAIACDPISKRSKSYISIYSLKELVNGDTNQITRLEETENKRATTVNWCGMENLIVTYDDGTIKKMNYKTGEIIKECKIHDESIKFVSFSNTKRELLTSSLDSSAKIIDIDNFEIKKCFKSSVPVNCAIYTPDENYVMLGGGIEAMMVAKTSDNDLTTKIYQVSNEKLVKQIINHFGPLRYLDFNANKSSFVSASQDGTAKIHYLTPITNEKCERELFGLALIKDKAELCLKNEILKIEEINQNIKNNSPNSSDKNSKFLNLNNKSQLANKSYPLGHELYKKEEKVAEYKINSRLETEIKQNSAIKVTNLPDDVDVRDLWEMFEFYGRIEENGIRIKKFHNDTVAFVNYLNIESAQKAIEKCDKKKMGFCIIGVEMTQTK
jgi:translation initiation factor 3 subunit I